jgi:hypothetical protein
MIHWFLAKTVIASAVTVACLIHLYMTFYFSGLAGRRLSIPAEWHEPDAEKESHHQKNSLSDFPTARRIQYIQEICLPAFGKARLHCYPLHWQ